MIRFRPDSNGGARFVEASPEDIRRMRKYVRAELWNMGLQHDETEDIAQDVEVVTWRALAEGRIREAEGKVAFDCLRTWMAETAWRLGMNYRRLARFKYEVRVEADFGVDPNARLDARELLARLRTYPAVLALLVNIAEQKPILSGRSESNAYLHARRTKRWFKRVRDSGLWQEPPGYEKPRPRDRKRGR